MCIIERIVKACGCVKYRDRTCHPQGMPAYDWCPTTRRRQVWPIKVTQEGWIFTTSTSPDPCLGKCGCTEQGDTVHAYEWVAWGMRPVRCTPQTEAEFFGPAPAKQTEGFEASEGAAAPQLLREASMARKRARGGKGPHPTLEFNDDEYLERFGMGQGLGPDHYSYYNDPDYLAFDQRMAREKARAIMSPEEREKEEAEEALEKEREDAAVRRRIASWDTSYTSREYAGFLSHDKRENKVIPSGPRVLVSPASDNDDGDEVEDEPESVERQSSSRTGTTQQQAGPSKPRSQAGSHQKTSRAGTPSASPSNPAKLSNQPASKADKLRKESNKKIDKGKGKALY
ncbi:uncharacterized protein L3040_006341 [Drepanopeziza brunnea f. sp. 'multigermtubi']|uniref:Uncharacterized protein n=1 Tax=Marssonina brunnea f. sp. multigermtubi (strain MB_m1) TaxID=1072389 RepID=K1X676_MARBU|nr:uncharacterized protein MBM_01298 [Drepanopeziza brunnea f. sp. 'multigermtubi' MB_m1]EKD20616.1 hypothetical protein MBM_01298 [Drepanopeziza brunnea f. sp. 'multigermtubi' MB_m1]KAJ5038661.1 hypothetical protein L3040_006341 [Drepanopeziza brunnea f. sp. 'multigermtubi']